MNIKDDTRISDNLLIVNAVAMQTSGVGDYVYRVEQPSIAMGKAPGVTVINVSTISPYFEVLCLQADVLILHLLTEHDLLPIIEKRKQRNLATVYEISDNFAAIRPDGGTKNWFSDPVNMASAIQLIKMADAAQVTGEGLLERLGALNPNIEIFENQISELGEYRERTSSDSIVIGWGGSSGHTEDLNYIKQSIVDICSKYPDVRFSFMGDKEQFVNIFSCIPDERKIYTPPSTLRDYLCFLETLDIGIATMLDTPFNHCRSDIKFVEYASRGVVPVLSAITPYKKHAVHGSNAFLFDNNNKLKAILENLIQDYTLRKEVSRNAYDYVKSHRMEDQHTEKRVEYYKNICREKTVKNLKALKLTRLSQTSEAYDVEKTNAEVFLRKGVANEAKGNTTDARFLYSKAHELMPGYYLPLFWLGYSYMRHNDEEMAIEFFNRTIEKNPRSVRSLLYLGNILEWREEKMALQSYKAASSISPSYAPSIEAIALFYENKGNYTKAVAFYNHALEANPFYSKAIWSLGRVYATIEEKEKALNAFRIAADMAPLHKVYQLDLAEHLFEAGSIKESAKYCLKALEIDKSHTPTRILMNNIIKLNNAQVSKSADSFENIV